MDSFDDMCFDNVRKKKRKYGSKYEDAIHTKISNISSDNEEYRIQQRMSNNKTNKCKIIDTNSLNDITQQLDLEDEDSQSIINRKNITEREKELKMKLLSSCPPSKVFRYSDIQRIAQYTSSSIFDEKKCALWNGYVTNLQNKKKGTYINFYFRNKKKVALHRLLYCNYKGDIGPNEYIKYTCENKGICCNINHMVKFEYNSLDIIEEDYESDYDSDDSIKNQTKYAPNLNKGRRKSNLKEIKNVNGCDFSINIY